MKKQLLSVSVTSLLFACTTGQVEEKPNILIIHTDEHNFRTLGCYRELLSPEQAFMWGKEAVVETPNIDYLARQGILFRNCYATTPVSSPSRSSFLTGLYPQNAGVYTNDMVLYEEVETFGEILLAHGYATGYMGKLHLNGKGRPEWTPERNFGFTDNRYMYNRGHWKKIIETPDGPEFRINDDIKTTDSLNFTTDFLTNRAIEFIQKYKGSAFCCMLSLPDPHGPNQVRAPYDTLYTHLSFNQPQSAYKDTTGLPAWSHGEDLPGDRMENMARYYGMIKCIDDNIGRLLTVLRENGILEKTIIIFTSDHGDLCGEHGLVNKSVPLEASAKVPFIVSYPAKMPAGKVISNMMSVVDFAPTLLSYCGIQSGQAYDGRDLSALWAGEPLPQDIKDIVFMRSTTAAMAVSDWDNAPTAKRALWLSAVTQDYKLTFSENETDQPWLTDLRNDPDELVNCFFNPEYAETVKQLAKQLNDYAVKYNDPRINTPHIRQSIDNLFK
ncbi:sulfatase [Parabacteroides sp. OttesenSCG-928-K15]|nr:sulfatase [Parabacteroides sp. OttesenSCG-928-K15]